jgi:hypothetical protein
MTRREAMKLLIKGIALASLPGIPQLAFSSPCPNIVPANSIFLMHIPMNP